MRRPDAEGADVAIRIHNADGSESGACGNAARCVASLVAGDARREVMIETPGASVRARVLDRGTVEVDLGAPRLDPGAIGLSDHTIDTLHLPLPGDPAGCSMGNPHATFFVPDLDAVDVASLGPAFERAPLFVDRANIGFAEIQAPDALRLRVWERGSGLTLACGTGACAALVNAHRRGLAGRAATVTVDGGALAIVWRLSDDHVLMTGPAASSFAGSFPLQAASAV